MVGRQASNLLQESTAEGPHVVMPFTGRHYDLARQMCDYFCNFIKTGDPNGKDLCGLDLPRWETWSEEKPCTMMFLRDGAAPSSEPLPPFKSFISGQIMERMRKI